MTKPDLMEEAPVAWRHKRVLSSILSPAEYACRLPISREAYEPLYSASALAAAEARGREEAMHEVESALTKARPTYASVRGLERAREIVYELRAAIRRGA